MCRWRNHLANDEGQLHREDGPAVIHPKGKNRAVTEEWYYHGRRHRKDGPAMSFIDGSFAWYYFGDYYRFNDFCELQERNNEFELVTFLKLMYSHND